MTRNIAYLLAFLCCGFGWSTEEINLVPTYENCSVYLKGANGKPEDYIINYREVGEPNWQIGHKLVRSQTNPVLRTSIFRLVENKKYEVRALSASDNRVLATSQCTTWSSTPPIAKTIYLKKINREGKPFIIKHGGNANGWVRYVGAPGYLVNGSNNKTQAILFSNASYVILENLTVVGGRRHGIMVENSNNIIIRNCNISGWGRIGKQITKAQGKDGKFYIPGASRPINYDAGVYILNSQKITVEKSYLHDPRGKANSWFHSHPAGPCAMFMRTKGEIVVRYNDMPGSDKHRWNDVIESWGNGKINGGFVRDSDIYGNYLAFGNDDGIELDGGQCNVRFYNNKVEGTLCGISTAANLAGPSFIINNLIVNLGDERGTAGACVKNGGGDTYTKGKTFFYNNTFYTRGYGIAGVGYGKDKNRALFFGESSNNLLCTSRAGVKVRHITKDSDFNYDTCSTPDGLPGIFIPKGKIEKNGICTGITFTDPLSGNFLPLSAQKGILDGRYIQGIGTAGLKNYLKGAFNQKVRNSPYRNNLILADKSQIVLNANLKANENISATIRFTLSSKFKAPRTFRVLTNSVNSWLQLSPLNGTIKPNETITINIALNKQHITEDIVSPGCIIFKLDSGESFPVTFYARIYLDKFEHKISAADCVGAKNFSVIEANDHSTYKTLDFKADHERKIGDKKIIFNFEVPANGRYNISALARIPYPFGKHDSFFISIDGNKPQIAPLLESGSDNWNAIRNEKIFWELKKGMHTIELYPREHLYLKAIKISSVEFPLVGE